MWKPYKTSSPPPNLEDVERVLKLPESVRRVLTPPELGELRDSTTIEKPKNLLVLYLRGDVTPILQDCSVRPEHYTAEQRDLAVALYNTPEVVTPPETVDELFLTWMRPTETKLPEMQKTSEQEPDLGEWGPEDAEEKARLVFGDTVVGFKM